MTLPRPALAFASARIAASNWDRFCVGAYPAPPSSTGSLSHVRQQERAVSAQQVNRILGVTYKNAWFLCHRIREALRDGSLAPMGGSGSIVEIDETFIGRKPGVEARPGGFTINTPKIPVGQRYHGFRGS
jgi:hypothetical protein